MRVATVDDDVALFEERKELTDKVVDGGAGFDEEDDLAWSLELLAELFDRVSADDVGACRDRQLKRRGSDEKANPWPRSLRSGRPWTVRVSAPDESPQTRLRRTTVRLKAQTVKPCEVGESAGQLSPRLEAPCRSSERMSIRIADRTKSSEHAHVQDEVLPKSTSVPEVEGRGRHSRTWPMTARPMTVEHSYTSVRAVRAARETHDRYPPWISRIS